jgi:hypothetical protein
MCTRGHLHLKKLHGRHFVLADPLCLSAEHGMELASIQTDYTVGHARVDDISGCLRGIRVFKGDSSDCKIMV